MVHQYEAGGMNRRTFLGHALGIGAALYLSPLEVIAQDKKDIWTDTASDTKLRQRALDKFSESEKDFAKSVPRFYALGIQDLKGTTTNKLVWGEKQVKAYDSAAHAALEKAVREHAKTYAAQKGLKEPDAMKSLTASLVDFVQNAKDADVWLEYSLWGDGKSKPIGIVPDAFWTKKTYANDADRRSRLVDYLGQKAQDVLQNPKLSELWKDSSNDERLNSLWIDSSFWASLKNTFVALFVSRSYVAQGKAIFEKKRTVSADYEKEFVREWQESPEFKQMVKAHREREDLKARPDSLGEHWGFTCLPSEGKVVAYDRELIRKYVADSKK